MNDYFRAINSYCSAHQIGLSRERCPLCEVSRAQAQRDVAIKECDDLRARLASAEVLMQEVTKFLIKDCRVRFNERQLVLLQNKYARMKKKNQELNQRALKAEKILRGIGKRLTKQYSK